MNCVSPLCKISNIDDIDNGDPGIIIIYATDQDIHQTLGLNAVNAIPNLQQGRLNRFLNMFCV